MDALFDAWEIVTNGITWEEFGKTSFFAMLLAVFGIVINRIRLHYFRWRYKKNSQRINRALERLSSLYSGLEVVQFGWDNGNFSEKKKHIIIHLPNGNDFHLPDDICEEVYDTCKDSWSKLNYRNETQVGIQAFTRFRKSERGSSNNHNPSSHQLIINAHRYKYFEFLATNRMYKDDKSNETKTAQKQFMQRKIAEIMKTGDLDSEKPIHYCANPLSVGLSLYCENGDFVVLTQRTDSVENGGSWYGKANFNAVGENIHDNDRTSLDENSRELSPWVTAARGLEEEMGFSKDDIKDLDRKGSSIILNCFVWDTQIYDYKFFGYTVTSLTQAQIEERYKRAHDKSESKKVIIKSVKTKIDCLCLIQDLLSKKHVWAPEAILSTIHSIISLGKLSEEDIIKLNVSKSEYKDTSPLI